MFNKFLSNAKIQFATVFGVCVVLILVAALAASQFAKPKADVTLSLSHTQCSGSMSDITALKFKELLEQNSDGTMSVAIYPNSGIAAGDPNGAASMLTEGSLDIYVTSPGNLGNVDQRFTAFWLPFIFADRKEAEAFTANQDVLATIDSWLAPQDMKLLALNYFGPRQISNNVREIVKPEDLQGIKFRVSGNNEILGQIYQSYGVELVNKDYAEVAYALKSGEIQGLESPVQNFLASKLFESQQYLTIWDGIMDTQAWVISNKAFQNLTPEQQAILNKTVQEVNAWRDQISTKFDQLYVQTLKQKGVKVTTLSTAERAEFIKASEPAYAQAIKTLGVDTINFFIDNSRVTTDNADSAAIKSQVDDIIADVAPEVVEEVVVPEAPAEEVVVAEATPEATLESTPEVAVSTETEVVEELEVADVTEPATEEAVVAEVAEPANEEATVEETVVAEVVEPANVETETAVEPVAEETVVAKVAEPAAVETETAPEAVEPVVAEAEVVEPAAVETETTEPATEETVVAEVAEPATIETETAVEPVAEETVVAEVAEPATVEAETAPEAVEPVVAEAEVVEPAAVETETTEPATEETIVAEVAEPAAVETETAVEPVAEETVVAEVTEPANVETETAVEPVAEEPVVAEVTEPAPATVEPTVEVAATATEAPATAVEMEGEVATEAPTKAQLITITEAPKATDEVAQEAIETVDDATAQALASSIVNAKADDLLAHAPVETATVEPVPVDTATVETAPVEVAPAESTLANVQETPAADVAIATQVADNATAQGLTAETPKAEVVQLAEVATAENTDPVVAKVDEISQLAEAEVASAQGQAPVVAPVAVADTTEQDAGLYEDRPAVQGFKPLYEDRPAVAGFQPLVEDRASVAGFDPVTYEQRPLPQPQVAPAPVAPRPAVRPVPPRPVPQPVVQPLPRPQQYASQYTVVPVQVMQDPLTGEYRYVQPVQGQIQYIEVAPGQYQPVQLVPVQAPEYQCVMPQPYVQAPAPVAAPQPQYLPR